MKNILPYINKVICGDVITILKSFPDDSIDCVITSPPYWQLRDYGWKGQWGLEKTYKEYLSHLFLFMDEVSRILKPSGTVWINLGDTYFGSGNGSGNSVSKPSLNNRKGTAKDFIPLIANNNKENKLFKKSLSLVPHRFAVGCAERGWIIRNDIIWAKPNALPESVTDRFSKKYEHFFFLVKNTNYYFNLDAVRDEYKDSSFARVKYNMQSYGGNRSHNKIHEKESAVKKIKLNPLGKNPGDVTDFWSISNKQNRDEHFATYNSELITKPILAGCPVGGIVLDPFCGTGTTCVRAIELGRNFIGIDGKKDYCRIAEKNIYDALKTSKTDVASLVKKLRQLNFSKNK
ncbi:MAG: site-specific DNA-methyltransferase [Bacteroidales bacterium]